MTRHSRSTIRRWGVVAAIGVLLVGLLGAVEPPPEGEGEVRTTLGLVSLDLVAAPTVGDLEAAIGTLSAEASTLDPAGAALLLEGLRAGDTSIADWNASSADGPSEGSVEIPLEVDGLLSGSVAIVDYLAAVEDGAAIARLGALTGSLETGPFGVSVDLGDRGMSNVVTDRTASGETELRIAGLALGLGDLLPPELLAELPLGVVLDLVDALDLDLDATLADTVDRLEALIASLEEVIDVHQERQAILDELRALFAEHPDIIDAEAALADAETALEEAEEALDDALADLAHALETLAAAEDVLADAEETLAAAEDLVAALEAEAAVLEDELADLQADHDLADDLTTETSLTTLLDDLIDLEDTYGDDTDCADVSSLLLISDLQDIASCYADHIQGLIDDVAADLDAVEDDLEVARDARDDAADAVADAAADVAVAEAEVATAQDAVTDAEAAVVAAQQDVTAALEDLEDVIRTIAEEEAPELLDELDRLKQELLDLADELLDLIIDLPDLDVLLDDLVGAVGDAPLIDLGDVTLTVSVTADAVTSGAAVTCEVAGVSVLGEPIETPSCDDLRGALDLVDGIVGDVLATLPFDELPSVSIAGLEIATSSTDADDGQPSHASAGVTALHANVPSVDLTGLIDDLTAELLALIDEVAGALTDIEEFDEDDLLALAVAGDDVNAAALSDVLAGLGDLEDAVATLPTGEALDGLRTVGLDLTLGGLNTEAVFAGTAETDPGDDDPEPGDGSEDDDDAATDDDDDATTDDDDATTDDDDDGEPVDEGGTATGDDDPDPSAAPDVPELPVTGGGAPLALLALGAVALLARRRR